VPSAGSEERKERGGGRDQDKGIENIGRKGRKEESLKKDANN
jgi:hypothetical protein